MGEKFCRIGTSFRGKLWDCNSLVLVHDGGGRLHRGRRQWKRFFGGVHHCRKEMLDDNVVEEMMHHETLCLTGEGVSERDIMSCCEINM